MGSVTAVSASSRFPCPDRERRTTLDAENGPESRRTGVPHVLHILQHTFCSHLAMRVNSVDSGAGGSPEFGDHAAVHAPDSSHVIGNDQSADQTTPTWQSF